MRIEHEWFTALAHLITTRPTPFLYYILQPKIYKRMEFTMERYMGRL